jgi:hypothetical protein
MTLQADLRFKYFSQATKLALETPSLAGTIIHESLPTVKPFFGDLIG